MMARGVLDDLRQGVRALRRAPGFCALALLTLALGIGGTSAMFSVVYGVLFRPLPFAAPEQLVRVWQTTAGNGQRGSFSPGVFLDVQRESRSLAGAAGYIGTFAGVALGSDPVRLPGAEVTARFFEVLGADGRARPRLRLGQRPAPAAALVVLSDGAWRQHFGADPQVVGRTAPRRRPALRSGRGDAARLRLPAARPVLAAGAAVACRRRRWRSRATYSASATSATWTWSPGSSPGVDRRRGDRVSSGCSPTTLAARHPDNDRGRGFDVEPVYDTIVGESGSRCCCSSPPSAPCCSSPAPTSPG